MDFTREPIIETVITPKDGCKLVVRSSKGTGQEEYFVDAVEVVSFGHSFFFRSLERPKMFFVPATDYEILEVREARMVLKNVGIDRPIKIGGGREAQLRSQSQKEASVEKAEMAPAAVESKLDVVEPVGEKPAEVQDKKRDRRRHSRRRREKESATEAPQAQTEDKSLNLAERAPPQPIMTTTVLSSLLPPPSALISETIGRYKDNILFKDAFYTKEEQKEEEQSAVPAELTSEFSFETQEYGGIETSDEEEGSYRLREPQDPLEQESQEQDSQEIKPKLPASSEEE